MPPPQLPAQTRPVRAHTLPVSSSGASSDRGIVKRGHHKSRANTTQLNSGLPDSIEQFFNQPSSPRVAGSVPSQLPSPQFERLDIYIPPRRDQPGLLYSRVGSIPARNTSPSARITELDDTTSQSELDTEDENILAMYDTSPVSHTDSASEASMSDIPERFDFI